MLNNSNSRGLSKSKEVDVLNFPGTTSADVLTKIDHVLNKKSVSLNVGTIKKEHLGIKKLHLDRKGNGIFAKSLLKFIEGNWDIGPLGDSYYETGNASNTIISNSKRTLLGIFVLAIWIDWFLDI